MSEHKNGGYAKNDRDQRKPRGMCRLIQWNTSQDDQRLHEKDHHHPDDLLLVASLFMMSEFDQILHTDIDQDQRPGDMILSMKTLPVYPGPLADKVQQKHINKQKHMLSDAVSAVNIDIVSRVIPNLDHSQCRQDIREERGPCDEPVFKDVQQGIIAADDIYEYQIVDQFDVFDLLFF